MGRPPIVIRLNFAVLIGFCAWTLSGVQVARCQEHDETNDQAHHNRLADETSPYLLQHAQNPVDWYPWGEEALSKAQREDKLIFLSIGYSSCHWCHVMEHESFEDEEIAAYMNEHFVCIKVDREERPDIDSIYMTAVQLLTRRGGWPLSVFLTPEGQPFFGGTYFPARDGDRGSTTGFATVMRSIDSTWDKDQARVRQRAEAVTEEIKKIMGTVDAADISLDGALAQRAVDALGARYDKKYGGFGFDPDRPNMPKFPQTSTLMFLYQRAVAGDTPAREMLLNTLDHIGFAGMRDHLGGGFHRYSVDRYWQIPHFEKMLYDNGQLMSAYAGAFQLTDDPEYRRIIKEMVQFLDREMTDEAGGFYSAMDADSEGEEGKYYRWSLDEWTSILGNGAELFGAIYAAEQEPNFEGHYFVPQLTRRRDSIAKQREVDVDQLETQLQPLREKLLNYRAKRTPPMTDKKILCSWNGLMIRGLADAGHALGRQEYTERAAKAANFVLQHLRSNNGQLQRSYSQGQPRLRGYLDDYAFLVDGLIALHLTTQDSQWLEQAEALTDKQIELFWDKARGGFYFTASDHEKLLVRGKLFNEGARPSGAAVAATNLIYLAQHADRPELLEKARQTIRSAGQMLSSYPSEAPHMLRALMDYNAAN